ncbi:uncharacterized protein LOC115439899 isoform X2 [Manduca sexta]|uniref:Uncharacterized protein n=1 Tax=Manduca sexta TaxID=7130 RepID=A0A921YSQ0_MANSE|nr:uncharacterized protein LOC115439899 isoform X2 [Manduca sexta]KAG6444490.1 hypothetical protein O3G_MSEX003404 [Manduca sexta]
MAIYIAWFIAFMLSRIEALMIERNITEYFTSDVVQSFKNNWEKYKTPLENAILRALKENYGYKSMNVYVRRMQDPYKLSKGYYHSDNQMQITLADLELDDLPYLWMPEVNFMLPSNVMQIGASLSKIIVRGNYVAFRNKSDIIYDVKDQNFYENSPFRFQQVENMGQLGIIIEGCIMTGMVMAILSGSSVDLGFNNFKLSKCQYTFEISTPGSGSPPVVAKYHPMGNGLTIENLLMRSLREELMPKLQATMFSFVNTSVLLGDALTTLQQKQQGLFFITYSYVNFVVRNLNRIAIEKNSGVVDIEDFHLYWNDTFEGKPVQSDISLTKMVLSGLETAYSANIGGPFKQDQLQLSEEIRFSTLRVRGAICYQSDRKYEYNFVAEMEDVAVEILFYVDKPESRKQLIKLKPKRNQQRFYVVGWRNSTI